VVAAVVAVGAGDVVDGDVGGPVVGGAVANVLGNVLQ